MSFPGFFLKRGSSCNKPTKLCKSWKPFMFSVFLLNKNSEMTPSPAEELQLMQAGLGKRNLSMNDDLTHSEVMHIDKYLLNQKLCFTLSANIRE